MLYNDHISIISDFLRTVGSRYPSHLVVASFPNQRQEWSGVALFTEIHEPFRLRIGRIARANAGFKPGKAFPSLYCRLKNGCNFGWISSACVCEHIMRLSFLPLLFRGWLYGWLFIHHFICVFIFLFYGQMHSASLSCWSYIYIGNQNANIISQYARNFLANSGVIFLTIIHVYQGTQLRIVFNTQQQCSRYFLLLILSHGEWYSFTQQFPSIPSSTRWLEVLAYYGNFTFISLPLINAI